MTFYVAYLKGRGLSIRFAYQPLTWLATLFDAYGIFFSLTSLIMLTLDRADASIALLSLLPLHRIIDNVLNVRC